MIVTAVKDGVGIARMLTENVVLDWVASLIEEFRRNENARTGKQ